MTYTNLMAKTTCATIIATFHRAAPARCGAFADEGRVVAGDAGG
jgi:hypothetical protein